MGQSASQSTNDGMPNFVQDTFGSVLQEIRKQANILNDLNKLTYEQFRQALDELNRMTRMSPNRPRFAHKRVLFVVVKDTDKPPMWKATVRIGCVRLNCPSFKVEMSQQLTLAQFVRVYQTFQTHLSAFSDSQRAAILRPGTAAADETRPPTAVRRPSAPECLICMDRDVDVSLSCAHHFCLPCIEQWKQVNGTCPVCMAEIDCTDADDDAWVLAERPEPGDVCDSILADLLDLTERTPE